MKLISFTGLRRLTCVVVLLLGGLLNVALFSQETDKVKSELFREIDAAMKSARQEEVPILSPNLYVKARELYRRADAEYKKGERLSKIRKRIAEAAAALKEAVDAAEVTKVALAEILRIRKESANRESAALAPNEFGKAEGKYKEAILKAEAGDIRSAKKKADEAMRAYREMTIAALLKGPIKTAEDQLKKGRAKVSRQTYKTAERDLKTLKKSVQNAKKQKFNPAEYDAKIRAQIAGIAPVGPGESTQFTQRSIHERAASVQTSNWPLYTRLSTVKPVSREEEEFAKALADKLNHTTAVVASNPTVRFPARSLATRVQEAYLRLDRRKQAAMQKNARALLSKTDADRQRYFGAYAARNADRRLRQADDPGLDVEMQALLRKAVRARLDAQRSDIMKSIELMATGDFGILPKTWVEAGFFQGDAQSKGRRELTITKPAILDFRWKTTVEGAKQGFWQLIGPSGRSQLDAVLASGNAGNAPGGIFTIDLGKFFPATPPLGSSVYQVRVQPFSKMILVRGATPGVISKKVPAKAVGPWSDPVIITYATTDAPPLTFDFTEIYRNIHFHLDAIEMVDDQVGPGAEEFYVAAFVKESFPESSLLTGKTREMGPYFAKLQPFVGSSKSFGKEREFNLNNPNEPEWPRSYAAVITVLEVDDGGTLVQWQEALWDLSKELTSGTVAQQVSEFLEELKEDLREEVGGGLFAEGVATLGTLIAASTGEFIAAYIVAIVSVVAANIAIGAEDDYYGTQAVVLGLLSNVTDYIQSFPGTLRPDGSYRHQDEKIRFKGYPTFPTAAAWDGVVDIFFHWEFSQKQNF